MQETHSRTRLCDPTQSPSPASPHCTYSPVYPHRTNSAGTLSTNNLEADNPIPDLEFLVISKCSSGVKFTRHLLPNHLTQLLRNLLIRHRFLAQLVDLSSMRTGVRQRRHGRRCDVTDRHARPDPTLRAGVNLPGTLDGVFEVRDQILMEKRWTEDRVWDAAMHQQLLVEVVLVRYLEIFVWGSVGVLLVHVHDREVDDVGDRGRVFHGLEEMLDEQVAASTGEVGVDKQTRFAPCKAERMELKVEFTTTGSAPWATNLEAILEGSRAPMRTP